MTIEDIQEFLYSKYNDRTLTIEMNPFNDQFEQMLKDFESRAFQRGIEAGRQVRDQERDGPNQSRGR